MTHKQLQSAERVRSPLDRLESHLHAASKALIRRWWIYAIPLAALVLAGFFGLKGSRRTLLLLFGAIAGLFMLKEPRRGLLLLPVIALFVPMEIGTGTAVALNSAALAVPLLAVLGLLQRLLTHHLDFASSRLNRPVIAFLLVVAFSWLAGNVSWPPFVPRPSNLTLVQIGQVAIYLVSFLALWLAPNLGVDLSWLRRIAYAFLGTVAVALVVLVLPRGFPLKRLIPRGLPNTVHIWSVALALAFVLCERELRPLWRNGLRLLLVLVGLYLWFYQRSWYAAWIPPLTVVGVILWWRLPRARWVLGLATLATLPFVMPRFLQQIDWSESWEMSGASRLVMWRSIGELAMQRPFLGLGVVAYRYYHRVKPIAYRGALWLSPTISAHNQFVDLFAQVGVLGLACYLWFIGEAIALSIRLIRRSSGFEQGYALAMLGGLMGMMVADMVAAFSLPFVYNVGFKGLRGSLVGWTLLGGLIVLENREGKH